MTVLLWLRAARFLNWYNWNSAKLGSTSYVVQNTDDLRLIELGQCWVVTSVHRTTGKVTMQVAEQQNQDVTFEACKADALNSAETVNPRIVTDAVNSRGGLPLE